MAQVTGTVMDLSPDHCREILITHRPRLGRLAFVDHGWPLVVPMNYYAEDRVIYFRTAAGSKLLAALRAQHVSFEIDHVDDVWQEGWSVLALGRLRMLTDPDEIAEVSRVPLRAWAGGERPHYLRMDITSISGRRIM
jgi:uncharacterized protein